MVQGLKKKMAGIASLLVAVFLLSACSPVASAMKLLGKGGLNVAIVVVDGAEILDIAGPGEVFAAASALSARPEFNVYTVGLTTDTIVSQGVFEIKPTYSIENSPQPDILIVPGGGIQRLTGNKAFMAWFENAAKEAQIVMSVCTGAIVLGEAGLLDGLDATTWHDAFDRLRKAAPRAILHENTRWVDTGKVITTAGVSAGIDGSLHVVARLLGEEAAARTARYMEYDKWDPADGMVAPAPQ